MTSPTPAQTSDDFTSPRIRREAETLRAMFEVYCRTTHASHASLCAECQELLDYALFRLRRCPFQENKTTCLKCPIHCYQKEQREWIRGVMRTAGPKMIFYHPILAILHLVDGFRARQVEKKENSPPLPGE